MTTIWCKGMQMGWVRYERESALPHRTGLRGKIVFWKITVLKFKSLLLEQKFLVARQPCCYFC